MASSKYREGHSEGSSEAIELGPSSKTTEIADGLDLVVSQDKELCQTTTLQIPLSEESARSFSEAGWKVLKYRPAETT